MTLGKCAQCERPGANLIRAAGIRFCDEHFLRYVEKKVKKGIRDADVLGRSKTVAIALTNGAPSAVLLCVLSNLESERGEKIVAFALRNNRGIEKLSKKFGVKLVKISHNEGESIPESLARTAKPLKIDAIATGHTIEDYAVRFLEASASGKPRSISRLGPKNGLWKAGEARFPAPLYRIYRDEMERYAEIRGFPVSGEGECKKNDFLAFIEKFEKNCPGTKHKLLKSVLYLGKL